MLPAGPHAVQVRNQTPQEREAGLSAEKVRQLEKEFFEKDHILGKVPSSHLGVGALVAKLMQVQ